VLYLETPPSKEHLKKLISDMSIAVRGVLRQKSTPYDELDLGNAKWSDEELLDFMMAHPILINRPIVVTSMGTKLCRPSEAVLDTLVDPQRGAFTKEDGEVVVNEKGLRVSGH
jgi:arsenate reductase